MNNSINRNGISVCPQSEERYVYFDLMPRLRRKSRYCQYDYRHTDGELFSTVGHSLEKCREKRDIWLLSKSQEINIATLCEAPTREMCATCDIDGYCDGTCRRVKR